MARKQKSRLGRGLSGLVSAPAAPIAAEAAGADDPVTAPKNVERKEAELDENVDLGDSVLSYLLLHSIEPNPFQPRSKVEESDLAGLAESIRTQGVLQPIVVRPIAGGRFQIVAGERRWRAAAKAGLERLPALVRELDDQAAAELALIENVQREDLNPVDRAQALRRLGERFNLSQSALAERVGLSRPAVANLLRLLDLEPGVLELLAEGKLTAGHAKALLGFPPGESREQAARRVVASGSSVRAVERWASDLKRPRGGGGQGVGGRSGGTGEHPKPPGVLDLERRLGEYLGTSVSIVPRGTGQTQGRVVIDFYDLDHFDDLMRRIGLSGG